VKKSMIVNKKNNTISIWRGASILWKFRTTNRKISRVKKKRNSIILRFYLEDGLNDGVTLQKSDNADSSYSIFIIFSNWFSLAISSGI